MLKKLVLLVVVLSLSFTFAIKDATSAEKEFRIGWLVAVTGWAAQSRLNLPGSSAVTLEHGLLHMDRIVCGTGHR